MLEEDIQKLYSEIVHTMGDLESEFMYLEKGYFSLTDNFEKIDDTLSKLLASVAQRGNHGLNKRVITLRTVLKDLKKKRGYDIASFQNMFFLLKKIINHSPDEIVQLNKLKTMEERLVKAHEDKDKQLQEKYNKVKTNNLLHFIMVRNGNMRFLIRCEEKVWSKKIELREPLKLCYRLKIYNVSQDPIEFNMLPGDDVFSEHNNKKAAFAVIFQGTLNGFICDKVLGSFFIKPSIFNSNVKSWKLNKKEETTYFIIKGDRFFIR